MNIFFHFFQIFFLWIVCIIFFIGGVQLFCVGVLGQYVSKTYLETKKRPLYIVKESDAQEEKRQKP